MGRMLDTLKRREERISALAEPSVPPPPAAAAQPTASAEEELPFIEVGAPGKKVEGSPSVLAVTHPPQAQLPPPHHRALPVQAGASPKVVPAPHPVLSPWGRE